MNLSTTRSVSFYVNNVFWKMEQMKQEKIKQSLQWIYIPRRDDPEDYVQDVVFEYKIFRQKGRSDVLQYHLTDDRFEVSATRQIVRVKKENHSC